VTRWCWCKIWLRAGYCHVNISRDGSELQSALSLVFLWALPAYLLHRWYQFESCLDKSVSWCKRQSQCWMLLIVLCSLAQYWDSCCWLGWSLKVVVYHVGRCSWDTLLSPNISWQWPCNSGFDPVQCWSSSADEFCSRGTNEHYPGALGEIARRVASQMLVLWLGLCRGTAYHPHNSVGLFAPVWELFNKAALHTAPLFKSDLFQKIE